MIAAGEKYVVDVGKNGNFMLLPSGRVTVMLRSAVLMKRWKHWEAPLKPNGIQWL